MDYLIKWCDSTAAKSVNYFNFPMHILVNDLFHHLGHYTNVFYSTENNRRSAFLLFNDVKGMINEEHFVFLYKHEFSLYQFGKLIFHCVCMQKFQKKANLCYGRDSQSSTLHVTR